MSVDFCTGVLLAGRYRLDGRIAVGGAGEVWRGVDLVLERAVAVKLLRSECAMHAETLERFRSEARLAGSLSDPHIAQVYDYGEADPPDPSFLVMELVDGPSLAGVLTGGPLTPARVLDVIAQAATGLHAAHSAGLVHCDIKPANLLIGPGGQVKITDFGIARQAGTAPPGRDAAVIGTPAYLSPERFSGAPASPAADLYALGIVAYECLTGVPPFTGDPREIAAAHLSRPLPPLPPAVPTSAAALIAELAAKEPAARPLHAGKLARRASMLRDALSQSATSQPDPWPYRFSAVPADLRAETLVDPQTPTMADVPARDRERTGRWLSPSSRWLMRAAVLAAAVIPVGLASWFFLAAHSAELSRPLASPPAVSGLSAGRIADVNSSLLIGRPVSAVRQRVMELGLKVRVRWQPSGQQPPGTVVSVEPAGQVPVGSIVVVTGALQLPGTGHSGGDRGDTGGGQGGGGGDGGGSDGGGNGGGGN